MQVFEFNNTIENNPFALTTDSLTICFKAHSVRYFKSSLRECFPDNNELTESILSKLSRNQLDVYSPYEISSYSSAFDRFKLFSLYFLIEDENKSFPFDYSFITGRNLTSEEKDYINLWCPRFQTTIEQIEKWSEIAKNHLSFNKYKECKLVETLQDESPYVRRIRAEPNQFPHNKTDLVCKTYKMNGSYRYVISELEFHRKYSHPNILGILDYNFNIENNEINLIMEYKQGAGYLPINIDEVKCYMKQLLNACVYMRKNLITHHNLKPDNIIYDRKDSVLKLIDLEFCKTTVTDWSIGNPCYIAPEKSESSEVGPSSDMYSVGRILETMLRNSNDFSNGLALDLISKMKNTSPKKRIHPLKALEHEFFQ